MFGGISRHFFRHVSISRNAFYLNFHILATQDEGAGFGFEDGEGDSGDGDRAVGGVGGGICGEGCVDGFAGIGGRIGEVVTMEADGVGGDRGLGDYSGRGVSRGHRVLLFAACECKKC